MFLTLPHALQRPFWQARALAPLERSKNLLYLNLDCRPTPEQKAQAGKLLGLQTDALWKRRWLHQVHHLSHRIPSSKPKHHQRHPLTSRWRFPEQAPLQLLHSPHATVPKHLWKDQWHERHHPQIGNQWAHPLRRLLWEHRSTILHFCSKLGWQSNPALETKHWIQPAHWQSKVQAHGLQQKKSKISPLIAGRAVKVPPSTEQVQLSDCGKSNHDRLRRVRLSGGPRNLEDMRHFLTRLNPKGTRNSTSSEDHPMSLRDSDSSQGLEPGTSPKSHTTPEAAFPSTTSTRKGTVPRNQGRGKVHKMLRDFRGTFFGLTQTRSVDTRLNRWTLFGQHNPTKLRALFQNSLEVSNTRGQKVHTATKIPDGKLEVHRSRIRTSAHADSHGAGPRIVQTELHRAKGREEPAKAIKGGEGEQRDQLPKPHKSGNQRKTQPTTRGYD